ncbi:hypothetical protein NECAME_04005 [Necator americanus]|uniref:Vacuolar protein sorting-associated protein 8 central domain-containing protein n=1 Tax=Necator americanus TaxID=51031 RepID=W2SXN0_NECAM|nr:hypothetical protein NECAME_04005 [Necator americanus]ETN74519.1 hypothetical protein NECAME_04005 [Necator americanus]
MLCDVSSFASHEVLSDSQVERGNRLLLYLHCCLAGHSYPYGTLPPEQLAVIPEQVYRCITSLKGKDGTSATANYPYLRLLLLFDAQQVNPIFCRMAVFFLFYDNRKGVCTFIYCGERKFVDLIKSYMRNHEHEGIFPLIRQILRADLSEQELEEISEVVHELVPQLVTVNPKESAHLVIDCLPDYLNSIRPHADAERAACFPLLKAAFDIKRERQENFLQMDEDVDEQLFGILFEGIVKENPEDLDGILQVLLLYWLPTGSRNDFCLNLAAAAGCANSTILLMEARGQLDNAFEVLFEQINATKGDQQRFVYWLDKGLSFCSCHSSFSNSREWLLRIMRAVTGAVAEENTTSDAFTFL